MKLKLTGILAVVMTLISFGAYAATTSAEDAKLVVRGWSHVNRSGFGDIGEVTGVTTETDASGAVLWYAVTTTKATVFVSPDDEIEPVIAVAPDTTGELPADHPLRAMLAADLPNRIAEAKTPSASSANSRLKLAGAPVLSKNASKWAKLKSEAVVPSSRLKMLNANGNPSTIVKWLDGWSSSISIMDDEDPTKVKTQTLRFWNQSNSPNYFSNDQIFNIYTPSNYVCGCVATAGSAVMHYFRPASGVHNFPGNCSVDGKPEVLDTKGGEYNWSLIDNLPITQRTTLPEETVDLLGRVAYDCGVGVGMDYSSGGSGAITHELANTFKTVFGMANAQPLQESPDIGKDNYPKLIYNQIRAGAPVVMGIQGHAVVACGYGQDGEDTDYTFVFMGWGGHYDAWYQLPEIETKSTAGGSSYTSTVVRRLVTEIAKDDKYIPLVGRVVDLDGEFVPNYEGLMTEIDGEETPITVDENGFWGFRVAPSEGGVVVDGSGEEHHYTIGAAARQTTRNTIEAEVLVNALPDEMLIEIDTSASGFLRVYNDPERALAAAWKTGKLLYVIGGTNEDVIAEWKTTRREDADGIYNSFKSDHIIVELYPDYYPNLVGGVDFIEGAFDPRVFSFEGGWTPENGLWDESDPANAWNPVDELDPMSPHARAPLAIKVEGLDFISSLELTKSYPYTATVVYADGLEAPLRDEFAVWTSSDQTIAKNVGALLYPIQGQDGNVTLAVENRPFAEMVATGDLVVSVYSQPIVIFPDWNTVTGGVLDQAKAEISDKSSSNAKKYAQRIAETCHVRASGGAGTHLTISSAASIAISNSKVVLAELICTGAELYEGNQLTKTYTFDATSEDIDPIKAGKQVGFDLTIKNADTKVKWVWEDTKYQVHTDATNCVIDQGSQRVANGETLTITALPPDGQKAEDTIIVWEGARPEEVIGFLSVEVVADSPRTIVANGVDKSIGTFKSANGNADAFVAPPGYQVTLVADKDNAGYYTYEVTEVPIAFTSIKLSEDRSEVTLAIEPAIRWCYYSIYGIDTLEGGFSLEGLEPVTSLQYLETEPTVEVTIPTGGNFFWKAVKTPGERPAED